MMVDVEMREIWLGWRGSGDIKSRVLQIGILLEDEWRQGEWNRAIELVLFYSTWQSIIINVLG